MDAAMRGRGGFDGRFAVAAWLGVVWGAACGGGGGDNGPECVTSGDCTGGAVCVDGRCVVGDAATDGEPDGAADGDAEVPVEADTETGGDADADDDGAADAADGDADADDDGADGDADADDDGADVTTCTDGDGDGYGLGCAAGPDCDDADPLHWNDCAACATDHLPGCSCLPGESFFCYTGPAGTLGVGPCVQGIRPCEGGFLADRCDGEVLPAPVEICGDVIDNDCDGLGDEEAAGPCGDCDATCRSDGEVEPEPDDPGATGLMTNPDGPGVVLGSEDVRAGYLWSANDPEGTVSKVDLVTGSEVSRYRVGLWGNNCDSPSRTAVDSVGNAYVSNRAHVGCAGRSQGSVTKMAGDQRFCLDRNGSTVIDTSTGAGPLALGADECVIWTAPVGTAGGIPRSMAVDFGDAAHPEGYPWVGLFNEMRAYQLDPDTGAVLATVDVNVNPYGFAIDSTGWIWISGRCPCGAGENGFLQRFHTVTRVVEPRIPFAGCGPHPYGITVDIRNRPWLASWYDGNGCAARWDPATSSWFAVNARPGGWGVRGVAADSAGTIWLSLHQNWGGGAIASFNMDDGSGLAVRDIAGVIPVGVGVDELGQVWTVNQSSSNVTRFTPSTGALAQFPVGPSPYTYSDFTGYQRRLMIPRGVWTRDYERCATDAFDRWGLLTWDADVPVDTRLTIVGVSADTAAGLATATPVTLATVPADLPPVDLEAVFAAAGVPLERFLRVTVTLEASPDRVSPVFRSLDVRWHCYRMP
jgi:hypothetical protein